MSNKQTSRSQEQVCAKKELEKLLNLAEPELRDGEPETEESQLETPKLLLPPQLPKWQFIKGQKYQIEAYFRTTAILRFLRDEGIHHIFQSLGGGWLTSYTDPQLVGICIAEC